MADRGAGGGELRHRWPVREERARLRTPSASLVRAWLEDRYPSLRAEFDSEFGDDFDELFDHERVYSEFHDEVEGVCLDAVGGTLEERTIDAVRGVRELVGVDALARGAAADPNQTARAEIAGLARSIALEIFDNRLSVLRVRHSDLAMGEPAASWVEATLGTEAGTAARRVSVLLRGPSDDDIVAELLDELADDAVPSLVWLTAGAVARFGDGDVAWLRPRRLTIDELLRGGA